MYANEVCSILNLVVTNLVDSVTVATKFRSNLVLLDSPADSHHSCLHGTRIKAVFSSPKSPPIGGRCALAHCPDTGTAHV